jgi:hypothetical protein
MAEEQVTEDTGGRVNEDEDDTVEGGDRGCRG